ncbi:methylmalonyl Co-A mutase-associated GTPase MeaB [Aeropyrum camini]|uniref:Transport system kinase n=1 Tax=Aeropyrum camini SY1 = JCM 12091 TaxID=1198449 RepID=U3TER3_9CREN|nr:methylmalonyl Co-A mutase-associated GTPase MeaB [Aeropyrum camini]BAN90520.1 transport system kinase [Aeropyrum camini SY1 = JCM 12091]
MARLEKLLEMAYSGNLRALGRLLTLVENPGSEAIELLERLTSRAGKAQVIGFTGIPGAGKSTLVSRVIAGLRRRGYKVAVVAIDPTSPFSGGSIMGDRLRMQEHAADPGVFIRSIPTRGIKGGLSMAALAMVEVFDAMGYDKIIIETVGVGQSEVDIINAAHTIIVVTMPGAGDDVQALKAGVMEIGDIYVVNKSDKPEANKTAAYLQFALEKEDIGRRESGWRPRLVKTSAVLGQGIEPLVDAIEEHWKFARETGLHAEKVKARRILLAKMLAESLLSSRVNAAMEVNKTLLEEAAASGRGLFRAAEVVAREAASMLLDSE